LLKRKASTRYVDDAGMTALHWAAYNGHTEIVEILCSKKGSTLKRVNVAGRTALHLAAMNSQFPVVELLLRKEMPMEGRCQSGLTALHYACLADSFEIARLLLMSGADIESPMDGELHRRPVHIAAAQGSMRLLNLLCDKGAFLDARDALGYRALGVASRAGHAAAVQNLLDRNSAVHMQLETWSRDDSPLCLAAASGHLPVVMLLLERGASPLKQDEQDWWPYQYAAYHGHPRILEILLTLTLSSSVADTLQFDGIGFAPAADISLERKREVLDLLYRAGHQPNSLVGGSTVPITSSSSMTPGPRQVMSRASGPSNPVHMPAQFASSLVPVPDFPTRPRLQEDIQELPGTLEQGLPDSRSQTPEQMHRPPSIDEDEEQQRQTLTKPTSSRTHMGQPPLFESQTTAQTSPPAYERQYSPAPIRPPLSHPTPVRDPSGFLLGRRRGLFEERFNGTPVSIDEETTTQTPEVHSHSSRIEEEEQRWESNSKPTPA
jgi:ankyrin repeat protein